MNTFARPKVVAIQRVVADYYRLPVEAMVTPCRRRELADARKVAMALSRQLTRHTLREIGACFGRGHDTTLCGIQSLSDRLSYDKGLQRDYAQLMQTAKAAIGI